MVSTPLENMKVSWANYSQYMEKKTFQTINQITWINKYVRIFGYIIGYINSIIHIMYINIWNHYWIIDLIYKEGMKGLYIP